MSHPPCSSKNSSTRASSVLVLVLLRSCATSMSVGWWPGPADGVAAVLPCLAPSRLAVGWSRSPPPNEYGTSAKASSSSSSRGGPSLLRRRLQGVDREVTIHRSHPAPELVEPYTRWLASDYHGTSGC